MDYTYSYLIANSALVVVWLFLFLFRKDVRREMLVMSGFFGIAGLFVEPVYIHDWWQPLTITGTPVGIEDFIFGAVIGGISAIAYEVIFKKRIRPHRVPKKMSYYESYLFMSVIALCGAFFFSLFYFGHYSSFVSSIWALGIPTVLILFHRNDLIIDSFVSGALMVFFGFWWFWVAELLTPGWVDKYWLHQNLSGVIIFSAPLEDLIWGFFAGAFIGPLYEFWHEQRLMRASRFFNL